MPIPEPPAGGPTLWELRDRVEAQFPDFPSIDVSAPGFSLTDYQTNLREMFLAMGIPREDITLCWQNLSCTVSVQPPTAAIKTVVSAFTGFSDLIKNGCARLSPHYSHDALNNPDADIPKTARILSNASGVVEPGTMCLVLGPSGSGSSLLLKRLAGHPMGSKVENHGLVLYNGQEHLHGVVKPAHFVQFVGQYDEHLAPLTVRHTLDFAADCKWPKWMPHVDAVRRNDVILTARMLRIERTLDTVVGDDVLRGVSGGERKRCTIAEMLVGVSSGCVIMDNWSKGLDSTTTLSITRSMREFAKSMNVPVITSMQAPGTDAFKLYDTVCVLDQGHVIYFGPRDQAEDWFKSLGFYRPPQRSIPDFIATVANPDMRKEYLPSHLDLDLGALEPPPLTSEEFAARFAESDIAASLNQQIGSAVTKREAPAVKLPHSLWAIAQKQSLNKPRHQIKALGKRQIRFFGATRNALMADLLENLILGVILGSIFWQLPDDNSGATSRGGIVFLSLLFIGLSSLAKIADKHREKKVFAKQRYSSFYSAWPYILTYCFFDIVVELARTSCFLIPLYLMAGLSLGNSAQRLLYAVLLLTMLSLMMIAMTRVMVAVFDDSDVAQGVGGILTIVMALFAGFLKRPHQIKGWIKWVFWADPIHYLFEGLALNEYDGLVFKCKTKELLPANEAVPVELRQCPVGTGLEYLKTNLGITHEPSFRLELFLIAVGYLVVFVLASAIATACAKPTGHALRLRSRTDKEENLESYSISIDVREDRRMRESNTRFTFSDVKYAVNGGKTVLLEGISGHAVGGRVVLLMGESGAGKSTLLDVCAMRKTLKKGISMEGNMRINGVPVSKEKISHWTGYCEQNDMHLGEATVKEAVCFSATLRLPSTIPQRQKNVRAMDTIDLLGLSPFSDVLVKSLGAGELKLLTMALEVVADPIVLFLDEPTSGISASSALVVADALRKIADTGTSVVCTVHQPSTEVFSMFDQLLLLKRGGKQVYFGDIGEKGAAIQRYFESRGADQMNEDANPADWMLDVISDESKDWAGEWLRSEEKQAAAVETEKLEQPDPEMTKETEEPFQGVAIPAQMKEVVRRLFRRYWRLPEYNFTRVILMFTIAFLIGILFLRDIDDTQEGATLAFGALFLTTVPSSLSAQNVIPPTVAGRSVFYREIASGTYTPLAFHIALGLVEIPFTAVATTVFAVVFYFMVGLEPSRFGYFFLAAQLLYYFSVALGVVLASVTPNEALALTIASSIVSVFLVLSGFFIRKAAMPVWWRWSTWINPFYYYLSGIVQNQMSDRDLTCEESDLLHFPIPDVFNSCKDIPNGNFTDVVVEGVKSCNFCPIPNGQFLIDAFGADDVDKWVGLVALLVCIMVCRLVAGFGFAKLRFISR